MSRASETFLADLGRLDAPTPWRLSEEEVGLVLDANGVDVLQVDISRDRSDERVSELALSIVVAVNACAGFKAEISNR